jgi:hypothetical protein
MLLDELGVATTVGHLLHVIGSGLNGNDRDREDAVPAPAAPGYAEAMQHTVHAADISGIRCPAADWGVGP